MAHLDAAKQMVRKGIQSLKTGSTGLQPNPNGGTDTTLVTYQGEVPTQESEPHIIPPVWPEGEAAVQDRVAHLNERLAQLDNVSEYARSGGYDRYVESEQIRAELERIEAGYRPTYLLPSDGNGDSRAFHAHQAGIDPELLDAIIEHEGGNFHSRWRGPFIAPIQEGLNDLNDIGFPIADTSVGYAQIQPANAVAIARETFGIELTHEEARERLSGDDEFSNAIAAEFLAHRERLIDPAYRNNRNVFTSYAAGPATVAQFNEIGWDFDRAQDLVDAGELDQSTYDVLYDRYTTHWQNATD